MPIVRRNLTVHFQKSVTVTSSGVTPQSVEATVIPLQDASNAETVATYVGGAQTATATLLQDDNVIVFALVPSNFPGLSNPINYRIMWRVGGVTGRTVAYDFAMPDVDISFDELASTNSIIGSDAYLQQADLGVAGRVAKLNDEGKVIDAFGEPVATLFDVASVQGALNTAVTNLEQQAQTSHTAIYQTIDYNINAVNTSLNSTLQQAILGWDNNIKDERDSRVAGISTLNSALTSLSNSYNNTTSNFSSSISSINSTLVTKADIGDSGYIPLSQIPPEAITNWIPLQSASERLNLSYPDEIQLGDIVLTPTGVYGLTGVDPSITSSWYLLNHVLSVNGQTGTIVLTPSDVGAMAEDASIPTDRVTGLLSALDTLATKVTTTSLQNQVTAINNDSTIVRLGAEGQISNVLLDDYVAYVNVLGQITKKDGTVISDPTDRGVLSVNGKTEAVVLTASDVGAFPVNTPIEQANINGLVAALSSKADLSAGKVLLSQVPTLPQSQITALTSDLALKASLVGGTVPLVQLPDLPQGQITGLSAIIAGNQLTASSNAINRITGLESRVISLETTGGGGGGSATAVTSSVYWGGLSDDDVVEDFGTVTLASPFGIYASGPDAGKYYYNKNGVPSGDAAFPHITPGGHLKLYKWNESGPDDVEYATVDQLGGLSETVRLLGIDVAKKALATDLLVQKNRIDGLSTGKADLENDPANPSIKVLAAAQIPFSVKSNPKVVTSSTTMRNLTLGQVHVGDTCIVTGATGTGTYTLLGSNVSAINNVDGWALHPVPATGTAAGTVVSISGPSQVKILPDVTGNISLTASDIGAATTSALSNYVTSSAYTTGLSGKTSPADVNSAIGSSQSVRGRVDYVVQQFTVNGQTYAVNGLTIINGAPSGNIEAVDKDANSNNLIYPQNNALVLLTNQQDSRYNGIWKVNSGGAWLRVTDYNTGNRVYPGTLVIVNNRVPGGIGDVAGASNYTIWQNSNTLPAIIDGAGVDGGTAWKNLGSIAPLRVTGENGISVSGTYPNITISSDAAGGFVRKYNVTTTPTQASFKVTHNLNTRYPQVAVIDDTSNAVVLVGWKVDASVNGRYDSITIEFSPLKYNNSYRISVQG